MIDVLIAAFNYSWPFFSIAAVCFMALILMGEIKPMHEILKSWWKEDSHINRERIETK